MAKRVLEVSRLVKDYGEFRAVDGISFGMQEGEVLGLLGPNGAGKSTTIQMLLGLTFSDGGEIKYFGKELGANREEILSRVNYSSAYSQVQGRLTVEQNLKIYAGFYGVDSADKRIAELAKLLEIEGQMDQLFWKLSSGQKTRAVLAKALINSPKVILMDEPTASLDPDIVDKILDLIRRLQEHERVSILYTSHNMEEVTRICDRVMFLYQGRIVAEDTPVNLTKLVGNATLKLTFAGVKGPVLGYLKDKGFEHKFVAKQMVEIGLKEEDIPKVLFGLKERKVWITDIRIVNPTLEDVFLTISRKGAGGLAKG